MSEDRLRELGIPRRGFLKKTAAAAFVAPVVVSFALDGVAEASPLTAPNQSGPNQTCSNQASPIAERDLVEIIFLMVNSLGCGGLSYGKANSTSRLALNAALAVAEDSRSKCAKIAALITKIESLPDSTEKTEALFLAKQAQIAAGCSVK
jgi:hypothetical protein